MRTLLALPLIGLLTLPAFAEDATPAPTQTVGVMKVDPSTVATGWRVSKIIGSTVVNEQDETIGTVDDLILTGDQKVPFAILSVGGFLGVGSRYVAVPFQSLDTTAKDKTILAGGSKDGLMAMPEFKYAE